MSEWQPISTAPKDGTWVLLRGGTDYGGEQIGPAVVAFWSGQEWAYAYWDGEWRSCYDNPTEWMPIPKGPE